MVAQSPKDLVPMFFDNTAKTYDKISVWATFGKDRYWKKMIVSKIRHADNILDLACGTGILTRKVAVKFPKADVKGVDITKSYLDVAQKNSLQFSNISFIHQDAENLNLDEKFDCICSSYIPKYADPKTLVKTCVSHLKPDGVIVLHDFTYPRNIFIQTLWGMYFVLLGFVGNFIPAWKEAFVGLPKLIRSSMWVDDYRQELQLKGFDVKQTSLTWHSSVILVARQQQK